MIGDFDDYPMSGRWRQLARADTEAFAGALDTALNDFGWIPDPSFKRAGTYLEVASAVVGALFLNNLTLVRNGWREQEIERLRAELEDAYRTIRAYGEGVAEGRKAAEFEIAKYRAALNEIIDLPCVVPDHAHGGVHPPYLEWLKAAAIARAALGGIGS